MDQTDRRSAHRRVGAATIAAFLVLLLLGATRGPAEADTTTPAPAATPAPTVEPTQPVPVDPGYDPRPRFGPHDGDDDENGDGEFGGDAPDDGGFGGGSTQVPSTSQS